MIDLRRIDTWIFDLDDTLYSYESGLWPQINDLISAYIKNSLGVDDEKVADLRKHFRQDYGGALQGLMAEYKVDAAHFLQNVHDIDYSALQPEPVLKAAIEKLAGRKFIFTNGDRPHAERALERMALAGIFDDIYDITAADLIPKPKIETYEKFLRRYDVDPAKAVMFEDSLMNLQSSKKVGMHTVWIGPDHPKLLPDFIDIFEPSLHAFFRNWQMRSDE